MNALLSIIGLYIDKPDLFDDFHLPDALDKDALVNLLLADLGELNTIYSDPDVMKFMINMWSKSRVDIWEHLQATKEYDYNPIWNKDGTYTETETRDLAGTNKGKVTGSNTEKVTERGNTKAVTDTTVKDTGSETSTTQRSAFDSSSYQPVEKVTTERTNTSDTDGTVTTTGSSETNTTGSDERNTDINTTDTGTITRTRRESGNIGVTTTQQMIREEREIADLDLYHLIINEFKNRFCIMVY